MNQNQCKLLHKRGSDIQSDRRFRATRSINSRMGYSDNRPENSPATTGRTRWTSMVTCGTKVLHHSFNFVPLVCCALPSSKNQFTTSLLSVSSRVQSGFVLSSATTKIYSPASVFASTPTKLRQCIFPCRMKLTSAVRPFSICPRSASRVYKSTVMGPKRT